VARLRDFELNLRTHFRDIDFPEKTLSPSRREQTEDGWKLRWHFTQIVSGFGIGMVTPQRIQPGELASALAFSAPISLLFYFLVIYVLATLRRIDIHPLNYFFIAGAFYAFHLLFAYSADHLTVEVAFALCSAVSIALCASYLRLVVSARFALREAALAQVIYLIGFSLAHFFEGFTGLTVTVLAIVTLFVLMQLTGRVRWSEALAGTPQSRTA
jgi:inner membrane protein involved in colicin E2 resistance